MQGSARLFYALCLPIPALALIGVGFGSSNFRRKKLFGLFMLMLVLAAVLLAPACVSYTHLGNVGTPPGQYTVTITGQDSVTGASQAGNPAGTTNTVVVTVTQQ